jgi:predicted SAM-dependent methyltransferase
MICHLTWHGKYQFVTIWHIFVSKLLATGTLRVTIPELKYPKAGIAASGKPKL